MGAITVFYNFKLCEGVFVFITCIYYCNRYKKNIQKVYVLHPTLFVRFILSLMKPFLK